MVDERDDSFLRAVAYVAPVDPQPLGKARLGQVLGGKYLLQEVIGSGGMAHVFAARHQVTGKRVAVKWMRPQSTEADKATRRFVREARAVASIEHPNVVAVHDAGTHQGSPYLVMDLLEGQTLRERLRTPPALAPREAVAITLAVIDGVREAHKRGILHRDIKPDNVFLCARAGEAPLPKVLDFGVSGVVREHGDVTTLTDHGTVVGTPGYMPLEQLQGTDELDQRADVYAVGVVLYEMLTGQRPFPARTYGDLIVQLARSEPRRPDSHRAEVDAELSAIVMKAIARDRSDRYADLESMGRALAAYPRLTGLRGFALKFWRPALLGVATLMLAFGHEAMLDTSTQSAAPKVAAPAPRPTPEPTTSPSTLSAPIPAEPEPAAPARAPEAGAQSSQADSAVRKKDPQRPRRAAPPAEPSPAPERAGPVVDPATTLRRTDF